MPDPISRRAFLQVTAAAGAAGALGFVPGADAAPRFALARSGQAAGEWFDRPMRWAQLTLVENDPGRFDPQFWLDYFRRLHADAATLSAGGIVAYYPTAVPLHHRSAWLAETDPFGTLVAGCRAMNMNVLARVDPHAVRDEVRQAHPDWIATTAAGEPRRHWANPELWVTCALGPYNFDFIDRVNREIVSKYPVDGVFANRWAPQGGDCYCVHCQRNFKAATGRDLPRTTDRRDPARLRVRRMAHRAADGAVEALGRVDPRDPSRGAVRPERAAEHEDRRRARRHPVRRLPGPPGSDAAVGERAPRQGIPRA